MYKQFVFGLSLLAVILAGSFLITGCDNNKTKVTTTPESHRQEYFNVRQYINTRVEQLTQINPLVEKVAYLNGKEEHREVHFNHAQWQTELAPFLDADIAKTAFIKRYQVDTLRTDDTLSITYIALDDKLRTRELKLYFRRLPTGVDEHESAPFRMEATLNANKVFYHSAQHISFTDGQGYQVHGRQDILLFGTDTFAVKARFAGAL